MLLLLLLLLPLLAGCAGVIDSEQLRLCRSLLPALNPGATGFREIRVGPAALGDQGVEIDYAASASEPGAAARVQRLACGFGGSAFAGRRLELVAVATERGPLGPAQLTMLKRYWLAAPGIPEAPAGEAGAQAGLPQLPTALAYGAQQLVNATSLAAIYALLASAYALIYGLIGRINLAFGQIAVLGAFGTVSGLSAAVALGLGDPVGGMAVACAVAAAVAAGWSWLVGAQVVGLLHARHRHGQPILVATAAVALAIQEMLRLTQGVRDHWVPPVFREPLALARAGDFIVTATPMQLAIVAVAIAAAAAVLWAMAHTRFGRDWRACADDPEAAALMGVAPPRVLAATFVLAGALAGLAGWIIAVYYGNVDASMGMMLGLKALVAAVVGGIGSVPGACLGGVLVALVEAAWSAYFDIQQRDIVVYGILIVVFVLRPGGLLGFSGPRPREV
jgi:branched-chain amino acid transport system permease protein